jgi:hypothetical protein
VGQLGRQPAEAREVLALADLGLAVADADEQAVEQVDGHREEVRMSAAKSSPGRR